MGNRLNVLHTSTHHIKLARLLLPLFLSVHTAARCVRMCCENLTNCKRKVAYFPVAILIYPLTTYQQRSLALWTSAQLWPSDKQQPCTVGMRMRYTRHCYIFSLVAWSRLT